MVTGTWYAALLASVDLPTTLTLVGLALATVAGRAIGENLSARVGDGTVVGWSLIGQTIVLAATAAAASSGWSSLLTVGIVLSGLGFGVSFGPLFALAFAELSPGAGVTLVGMLVVGNLAALLYPWLVGHLFPITGSYAWGLGAIAVTIGGIAVVWVGAISVHPESRRAAATVFCR